MVGRTSAHVNDVAVRTGIESNHLLPSQPAIEINGHAIEVSYGRHRAQFAIRKQTAQLRFRDHARMSESQRHTDLLKIHQLIGWEHQHMIAVVPVNDHSLGDLPCGQVLCRSDLAGRVGERMNGM
jgi:hypothetical protein